MGWTSGAEPGGGQMCGYEVILRTEFTTKVFGEHNLRKNGKNREVGAPEGFFRPATSGFDRLAPLLSIREG